MPPASEFNTERYRQDVLEPARKAGNTPPPDLMTRYAVSAAMEGNKTAFNARVDEVVKYWRRLQQQIVYKPLAVALIAGHARLKDAGELNYASFSRQRTAGRDEALTDLEARVKDIAASTPAVLRSMVTWLFSEYHGLVTTSTITSKLASHQVAVLDHPWILPARPSRLSGLATRLDTLDLRLAAETVFGTDKVRAGFQLHHGFALSSGERITSEELAKKKKEVAQRPHDDRKTAHEEVLQVLQQCADRGELDALLLWQLIEVLQRRVTEGLPNRSVVSLAASLGFDRAEAAELVLTLTQQRSADRGPTAAALRKQVSEAEQAGDTEEAAALIAELIAAHGDDDTLGSRLRSLPPPPPARVAASDQGDTVRIEWQPGPVRAGHVHYRVVRSCGSAPSPSAGLTVAETDGLSTTDHRPPNGVRLHYTVFAARGADVWSSGTTAAEVLRVPDVTDIRLEAHPDAVTGSWQVAPGTTDVIVSRAEGSPPPPGQGHPVPATLADFNDPGLQAGVRYYYRVCAVYVNDTGERWLAPGVVRWATPDHPLDAVRELHAELQPGGADPGIMLAWPTAQSGAVRIYRSNGPSPVLAGTSVRLDDLTRFGRPLLGQVVSSADGQSRLRVRVFNGRSCFTAITVGAERAVVGATATMAVMSPVTEPTARRDGGQVWLHWKWADDCHVCRIEWSTALGTAAPDTSPAECGRQRFDDDGGFGIVVGAQPVTISIRSVYRDASGEILSVPAQVPVPGRDILVRYAFERKTWWAPWRRDRLLLRADQECRLPPLTVVHKAGRIMPLRAEQGELVTNVPGAQLAPGRLLSVPIPDLNRHTAGWLACFFSADPPDGISLVPAPSRR